MEPDGVSLLQRLYGHNQWANARVFDVCITLDALTLCEDAPGTHGTIESTLKHLVGVEDVYLMMLRGESLEGREPPQSYMAHDLPWFARRLEQVTEGYRGLLGKLDGAFLTAPLNVPWFDFTLTKGDGLLQVLDHSGQHRAQVLSTLGARGVELPDVDYVDWVEGARGRHSAA